MTVVSEAGADGEAGLVIQDGETVTTYCVAFQGEGMSGDALLKAAGKEFDAYGGGSGLALCSIGERGCQDAGSFSSCFCECQGGDCTYWAFFTRGYGRNWVYSALAFNLLKAKDGELHGWKWGKGGPNSAPSPQDVTFEQVCGHSPQGGAATATLPPAPTTTRALQPTSTTPAVIATLAETITATAAISTPLVTLTNSPSPAPPTTAPTLGVPPTGNGDDSGWLSPSMIAFAAVAVSLVGAIAGAAAWRARHA